MADNLPEPESRKEQYLAKAAGMTVEDLPTPASREEQYLNAIAEGGGGGGTSDFDQLSNRPKYNGTAMTGETNIPASPTVVQDIGTSTTDVMSQDATTKLVYVNASRSKIKIGTSSSNFGTDSIGIGSGADAIGHYNVVIGSGAEITNSSVSGAIALGRGAKASQKGQFDVGTGNYTSSGYNNTNYRLITGVYDPQSAHDAATKGYVDTKLGGMTLVSISQTDYDNLGTKDPNTLYIITGA